ncbi:MAG TPA: DUF3780 domain-containing protein [Bacteroidales bacterium]|jgi:hypothetical protein|nr:DUF3780 domain-containing protein [Bacteroidales bacterium]HPM86760.1 DUF3780 domain-containing protein [Bacteroidales bacterium]HQM68887.1 DUF3780 domain-containing protein [Bacteroidales bacterium]
MGKIKDVIGFGFDPNESKHHFLVIIPKNLNGKVLIYERFEWGNPDEPEKPSGEFSLFDAPEQKIDHRFDRLKCEFSRIKWKEIEISLRNEFNLRLKEAGLRSGTWKQGQNPVQRLLGKEMTLLCWAIEDCDIRVIPTAIKNWQGLKPEERWWLYTMTNASTGDANSKYGWRTAVRYALTENPVTDKLQQRSIFDIYLEDSSDLTNSDNK